LLLTSVAEPKPPFLLEPEPKFNKTDLGAGSIFEYEQREKQDKDTENNNLKDENLDKNDNLET